MWPCSVHSCEIVPKASYVMMQFLLHLTLIWSNLLAHSSKVWNNKEFLNCTGLIDDTLVSPILLRLTRHGSMIRRKDLGFSVVDHHGVFIYSFISYSRFFHDVTIVQLYYNRLNTTKFDWCFVHIDDYQMKEYLPSDLRNMKKYKCSSLCKIGKCELAPMLTSLELKHRKDALKL
jgi:hypothetical protein